MKYLIVLIFLLSSCSYSVSNEEIEYAQQKCSANEGLLSIEVYDTTAYFNCRNGAQFRREGFTK